MFKVQNSKTKKFVKDAITGKIKLFGTMKEAEASAKSSEYYSNVKATAWNSIRAAKYIVVVA